MHATEPGFWQSAHIQFLSICQTKQIECDQCSWPVVLLIRAYQPAVKRVSAFRYLDWCYRFPWSSILKICYIKTIYDSGRGNQSNCKCRAVANYLFQATYLGDVSIAFASAKASVPEFWKSKGAIRSSQGSIWLKAGNSLAILEVERSES